MGILILLGGLFMEPFQGGAKKDPSTLSYFFITAGIAFIWVFSLIHANTGKQALFLSPVKSLGKNALMAYFIAGFLIMPLLNLSGLTAILGSSTYLLVLKALLVTGLSAAFVHFLTLKGLFWKL
jgi:hypothetical protein